METVREHGRELHPQRANARQVLVPAGQDLQLRVYGKRTQP
jgi:hypothetical protein